jgi:DMSO reductase anchor subunit
MNPAFSVISFTTLLGASQGLVVTLAVLRLAQVEVAFLPELLLTAVALLVASLGASFLHLGHPERAWRAAAMWRTSWLSREVIVLPIFIGFTLLWAFYEYQSRHAGWIMVTLIVLSFVLWICTAMIYACIKFIQEWSNPFTIVNYVLIGWASGLVLACSLLAIQGQATLLQKLLPPAMLSTLVAALVRWISIRRNQALSPKSTLQSATGIRHKKIEQKSMGMSAGAFNTREFFHHQSERFIRNVRAIMLVFGLVIPMTLLAAGGLLEVHALVMLAFPMQALGLLAERWFFFAQARHPQNLYYQTVS